jgi:hypothetical protein
MHNKGSVDKKKPWTAIIIQSLRYTYITIILKHYLQSFPWHCSNFKTIFLLIAKSVFGQYLLITISSLKSYLNLDHFSCVLSSFTLNTYSSSQTAHLTVSIIAFMYLNLTSAFYLHAMLANIWSTTSINEEAISYCSAF